MAMKRGSYDQITWQQYEAANYGLSTTKGDTEVLEDLGIATTPESLLRQVEAAAEVARLLGIDTRTEREKARAAAHLFYAAEFNLSVEPDGLSTDEREILAEWVR
jgi:hypothetical protein